MYGCISEGFGYSERLDAKAKGGSRIMAGSILYGFGRLEKRRGNTG